VNLLMLSGDVAVAQGHPGPFHETLRLLSEHWERIDVLTPRAPGAAERALHGNVFVHPSSTGRALQPLFLVRRATALARERRYDLIVSHDYGVFASGVAARRLSRQLGVPFVSELHHVEGYPRAASLRERVYRELAQLYVRWNRGRAAAFRTVNRVEVPQLLARLGVPPERILVLPSVYLDLDVFRPLPDESKRYDVLLVGRLVANKGLWTLLDALAEVRRSRPVTACVLGEGPLRGELERRVAAHGLDVELVPHVGSAEDVARLYNRSRILVCASTAEGGPRVTLEAMACGVPVVSTPVGMMPELVRDGENGFLFAWDARELAARIESLLGDAELRARVGEAGRASVQGFEARALVGELARAYRELASGGTGTRGARPATPALPPR
jgi:glycosyltransferase involved in cell wall biosynthesis